jgi:hypothetical protein
MIKEQLFQRPWWQFLASFPYLFSPFQIAIGSFADRNLSWGFGARHIILLGLVVVVAGVILAPQVAFIWRTSFFWGHSRGHLGFWIVGGGFNFASSYPTSLRPQ